MTDINNQNQAQKGNWVQRNADWLMPIGTTAAQIGYNIYANDKNNQFNAQQAQLQRDYEERMSSTAYQRAYADMQAAGLNPHLAGGQGGASTPSGSAATTTGMMPINMDSTLNAALTQSQIENMRADTDMKYKNAGKSEKEVETMEINNRINKAVSDADIELKAAQTKEQKAQARKNLADAIGQEFVNAYTQKHGFPPTASAVDKFIGTIYKGIEKGENETNPAYGAKIATLMFSMM